ncbi:MAG: ABC transporter ATP-binding protein [Clostridia bacterium]|nr:ABC transporter ATP-binding protein [Clostridia bacterium]
MDYTNSKSNKILIFENVCKTFYTKTEQTEAIRNLNFEVAKGEFVALLGPSGCGKTTILSLACGILAPNSGNITLCGNNDASTKNIGYMLQRDHLLEWRNIYRNIALGLEIQGKITTENTDRINTLLDKYGLKDFAKHYPNQLSGGMRQRVALIRTLALNPDMLLLDEPFSALDFQTRLKVCDDVYSIIKKEQKTTILVTHDISEALSMADRIIVLSHRPCVVKQEHITNMDSYATPLKRREHPTFAKQFDDIWQELNV